MICKQTSDHALSILIITRLMWKNLSQLRQEQQTESEDKRKMITNDYYW